MARYETLSIAQAARERAPDGSWVHPLLSLESASMAHFQLDPGHVSRAVKHQTVGEIWLVLSGCGQMWRQQDEQETVVRLERGVCLSIPVGTAFQFSCTGKEPLCIVAVTTPPWPGDQEAVLVTGKWRPQQAGAT
jgi:mannose-6-phosphate isomerase-like protein (cupin superfamily)